MRWRHHHRHRHPTPDTGTGTATRRSIRLPTWTRRPDCRRYIRTGGGARTITFQSGPRDVRCPLCSRRCYRGNLAAAAVDDAVLIWLSTVAVFIRSSQPVFVFSPRVSMVFVIRLHRIPYILATTRSAIMSSFDFENSDTYFGFHIFPYMLY